MRRSDSSTGGVGLVDVERRRLAPRTGSRRRSRGARSRRSAASAFSVPGRRGCDRRPRPRRRTRCGRGCATSWASGASVCVDDDLGEAVPVAQVEEDELAVVAAAVDPAGERRVRPRVGGAQLAAGVGAIGRGEAGEVGRHGPRMVSAGDGRLASPATAVRPRRPSGRDAPADELATERVRRTLAWRAVVTAPRGQPALVRGGSRCHRRLGRVAVAVMAGDRSAASAGTYSSPPPTGRGAPTMGMD